MATEDQKKQRPTYRAMELPPPRQHAEERSERGARPAVAAQARLPEQKQKACAEPFARLYSSPTSEQVRQPLQPSKQQQQQQQPLFVACSQDNRGTACSAPLTAAAAVGGAGANAPPIPSKGWCSIAQKILCEQAEDAAHVSREAIATMAWELQSHAAALALLEA